MVLGLESTAARMSRISRSTLFGVPLLSLDEMIAEIDSVTLEDLATLAGELYDPAGLSAAVIGTSEDRLRSALPKVSEELAAAA
jgi:predicted Zn-dependent peptidase